MLGVVALGRLAAGAKAAMQVANIRDFDVDAVNHWKNYGSYRYAPG